MSYTLRNLPTEVQQNISMLAFSGTPSAKALSHFQIHNTETGRIYVTAEDYDRTTKTPWIKKNIEFEDASDMCDKCETAYYESWLNDVPFLMCARCRLYHVKSRYATFTFTCDKLISMSEFIEN